MCGGVSWPVSPDKSGDGARHGFAVMCGRNESTGRIFVFEQLPFMTVQWIRRLSDKPEDQVDVVYPALTPLLARSWARYLARLFYWKRTDESQDWYLKQCFRAHDPPPILPAIEPMDHMQAFAQLFIEDASDRLAYEPESDVHMGIVEYESAGVSSPALDALVSAIYGFSMKKRMA